jgi:hypothetical protein
MRRKVLLCEPGYTNRFLDDCLVDYTRPDNNSLLDGCDEVYYRSCIADRVQTREGWKKQQEPEIWCIVSGKRTGSTLIIDYLQKCNPKTVLALSEIFNLDNTYMESFDMTDKKGILYPHRGAFRKNTGDYEGYFRQFIDFATSRFGTTKLIFKYTIDFLYDYEFFMTQYDKVFNLFREKNIRIVYLNRNEPESYVSHKLALVYGFSNTVYSDIPPGIFDLKELHLFSANKHAFEARLFRDLRVDKILDYAMITKNHEENLALIHDVFGLKEEACLFDTINKKQNEFSYESILDTKNWR